MKIKHVLLIRAILIILLGVLLLSSCHTLNCFDRMQFHINELWNENEQFDIVSGTFKGTPHVRIEWIRKYGKRKIIDEGIPENKQHLFVPDGLRYRVNQGFYEEEYRAKKLLTYKQKEGR